MSNNHVSLDTTQCMKQFGDWTCLKPANHSGHCAWANREYLKRIENIDISRNLDAMRWARKTLTKIRDVSI